MNTTFRLRVLPDAAAVAAAAFDTVVGRLRSSDRPVLGLATGSSPVDLYGLLANAHAEGSFATTRLRAFALDEYVGLDPSDPLSFAETLRAQVARPLHLSEGAVTVPDGRASDLRGSCERFESDIRAAGGVDVQVVGLGSNGHLAFNEPGSSRVSRTRVVELDERTRRDNARFFGSLDAVPRSAVTQGIGTILEARAIVAIAQGVGKADAVARAVAGPIGAECPASFLRLHPDVTFVVDEAAASLLPR